MKTKLLSICTVLILAAGLLSGCGDFNDEETFGSDSPKADSPNTENKESSEKDSSLLTGMHHGEIVLKDYGTVSIELDADNAPITVTNFVNLAKDGFYDNQTFIRIQENFVIQGGDWRNGNMEKAPASIKGEFSENGVNNSITHQRGVLSMARSTDMNSADTQFFIMLEDNDFLDGNYAAFGRVTEGMDLIDQLVADYIGYGDAANMGFIADPANQPVIETIRILD